MLLKRRGGVPSVLKVASNSAMICTILRDGAMTTVGDALRELDKRNVVNINRFLLERGNVVANVASEFASSRSMRAMIDAHAKQLKADRAAPSVDTAAEVGGLRWRLRRSCLR